MFLQLRPDQSGRPITFITAGCMVHQRGIRLWLNGSWPFDPAVSFGVDQADEYLAEYFDMMNEDGITLLSANGVA